CPIKHLTSAPAAMQARYTLQLAVDGSHAADTGVDGPLPAPSPSLPSVKIDFGHEPADGVEVHALWQRRLFDSGIELREQTIGLCDDAIFGPFPAPYGEQLAPFGFGTRQRYPAPAHKLDAFVQKAEDVHRSFHVIAVLLFQLRPLAVFSAAAVACHPAKLGIGIALVFERMGFREKQVSRSDHLAPEEFLAIGWREKHVQDRGVAGCGQPRESS